MVKKFLKIIHKEFSGLHEAAFLLGFAALASQVLALLRDRLLASLFGAGQILDVYYAAFRLPDLVYVTVASFVSVTVMIPFLINKIEKKDEEAAKKLMDSVFTVFCLVMVVVSIILYILIPYLSRLIAPGFSAEAYSQLVTFSRILLLSPFLLGISNLLGSVTQSFRKFFVFALSPLLYNIGIILGITVLYPLLGSSGLVLGVVLGALLHLLIQLPVVADRGFLPALTRSVQWKTVREVVLVSLPRTVTLAASQISIIVLISLASFMKAGSIAVFNFSYNLQSVPLAIVGVSYSVAAFPALTRLFSRGEKTKYLAEISNAIRHIAFWSFISAVLFIVLRAQIVRVILGAGHFGWTETRLTAACLAIFAVSVAAQSFCQLFIRAFYAAGKTKIPLLINLISAVVIVALGFGFYELFNSSNVFRFWLESLLRVEDLEGTAVLVLPLAFSSGLIINAVLYWLVFQKEFVAFSRQTIRSALQTLSAALLGGVAAYEMLNLLEPILNIRTFGGIFIQGFMSGLVGLGVFASLLILMNNEEVLEVGKALTSRFWRTKTVAAEQENL